MTMQYMCRKVVVFDLDDTLYKEIDFLKSGYRKVAEMVAKRYGYNADDLYDHLLRWYNRDENPFATLNETYGIYNPIGDYLNVYRFHNPTISLAQGARETLDALKKAECGLGVITDGREITQRQKFEALGLDEWISMDDVFINEDKRYFKPNHWSFDRMMIHCFEKYSNSELSFYYVGDNTEKDFLAPNQLGWKTVCLKDDGKNIHKQDFTLGKDCLPQFVVDNINEIMDLI